MFQVQYVSSFGTATGPWSMVSVLLPLSTPSGKWMLAGSSATGMVHLLSLEADTATLIASRSLVDPSGTFLLDDAVSVTLGGQLQLYSTSRFGSWIDVRGIVLDPSNYGNTLSPLTPIAQVGGVSMGVSMVEALTSESGTFLATAARDRSTIEILRLTPEGAPRLVERVQDSPKVMLDSVSDMVSLISGTDHYLITASAGRNALSSFRVEDDGSLNIADSLTEKDGLWVSGLNVLVAAEVGGTSYVVAGSAGSGSLSVIRINPLGVMFVTDHFLDDRTTRFDAVSKIETVSYQGRSFLVVGGGDGGISFLELLPGGKLLHLQSLEARDAWAGFATGVTGLSVSMSENALDIFVSGAGGISRFSISMDEVGPLITGTDAADNLIGSDADDLIFGAGGNDTIVGGAGDDILVAGSLGSFLTGGAGRDIFRLEPGPQYSRILDFEQNQDRIDLSEWGRIYDISALSIASRAYGAQISYGDFTLRVSKPGGGSIPVSEWNMDDFLF